MVRHFGFLGDFDVQKNRDAEPKPNGTGYLFSFTYKNPIVDETVEIVSKYSEMKYSIIFKSVKSSDDFYILINNEQIKTLNIGNEAHQSSVPKFRLDKMLLDTHLPKNRKLYD